MGLTAKQAQKRVERASEFLMERLEYLDEGFDWYVGANRIARECPFGERIGAGVLAALSPRCPWGLNVKLARAVWSGERVWGLGRSILNAKRIITLGGWGDVLTGPKTRAFAEAIVTSGRAWSVCLDVWMGKLFKVRRWGKKNYEVASEALRVEAGVWGVWPAQLQAAYWVMVRNGMIQRTLPYRGL